MIMSPFSFPALKGRATGKCRSAAAERTQTDRRSQISGFRVFLAERGLPVAVGFNPRHAIP